VRRVGAAALVLFAAGSALGRDVAAQGAPETHATRAAPVVRYGKWGAAALFAVFTTAGVLAHNDADAGFRDLRTFCSTAGACVIGPDGRYVNPQAEVRYQDIAQSDRTARAWLLGGQIALGGAVALFVVELLHERGEPNIPFSGLTIAPGRNGTMNVGWRMTLR